LNGKSIGNWGNEWTMLTCWENAGDKLQNGYLNGYQTTFNDG
jgi:hypothetical protein